MWIFTNQGMISIVRHRDRPGMVLARARQPAVLKVLFPKHPITRTPDADYRYRAEVDREDLLDVMTDQLLDIDYDNFKDSITDGPYHMACADVWRIMHHYQNQQEERREPAPKYDPRQEYLNRPGEQARQKRIARSQFPDDFGGCSDNYK